VRYKTVNFGAEKCPGSTEWFDQIDYCTEICSGSEAGSNLRLIDFVYYSTLGLRVIKKKKNRLEVQEASSAVLGHPNEAGDQRQMPRP